MSVNGVKTNEWKILVALKFKTHFYSQIKCKNNIQNDNISEKDESIEIQKPKIKKEILPLTQ